MPSPYERARWVYDNEDCPRSFETDLELHLKHGFVFSTPDFFVMGRAVCSKTSPEEIVNPEVVHRRDLHDCWHVYLFAGDLSKAWNVLPYELPMFSLERKNELRFYKFQDLERHVGLKTA